MNDTEIRSYVEAHAARFLQELEALVSLPSISTLPEHADDVRRAAGWLAARISADTGVPAQVVETAGHPLVYGEWLGAPGKPTVLLYGHYDVQPVDPIELWRTPPFAPTVIGDSLYARGAVDDKGPTYAALKALEVLRATTGTLPVNIKILLEGEEESGGQAIAAYVRANPTALAADCALILDTGMIAPGIPTMSYGLRGITYCEIEARGAAGDLHSGVYGGIAPNPIQALCWALAEIKGRDGRINLPGLYEMMRPLSDAERAVFAELETQATQVLQDAAGLAVLPGEAGFGVVERATARPTFEVHGIRGGFTAEGAKTVIPALAVAKVSLRLVADQRSDAVRELLAARLAELQPPGITFTLHNLQGGEAVTFPLDAPPLQAASAALEAEFGRSVQYMREGGSIGVAALFSEVLQLPGVMMGFGLADDNVHAPNEKFHIPNFYAAIRSVAGFLQRYGGGS